MCRRNASLLLSAYDYVLKCSNTFNLLDARGAISVTERVGVIARVRKLAVGVAQAWMDQNTPASCAGRGGGGMSLRFLLEIGVEEVPDWMIEPALDHLRQLFTEVLAEHNLGGAVDQMDATPRRLVLRASGLRKSRPTRSKAVAGPPVSAGAGAASGFAKKMGVPVDQLAEGPDAQRRVLQLQPRGAGTARRWTCWRKRCRS